jgi:hypothetical protein
MLVLKAFKVCRDLKVNREHQDLEELMVLWARKVRRARQDLRALKACKEMQVWASKSTWPSPPSSTA